MTTQKIKDTYSDDVRLALLEQSINNINNTLNRFEKRFDRIDDEIKSNFRWLVTIFGSLLLGLSGIMAHGFHWF